MGTPLIITNSRKGWVEYSSFKLMPRVHKMIMQSVPVISARYLFEPEFPIHVNQWKLKTFIRLKDERLLDFEAITNLIVVGDQNYEIEAARIFGAQLEKCLVKTVKLSENPLPSELIKQLKVLNDKWDYILSAFKNLTIKLERKQ